MRTSGNEGDRLKSTLRVIFDGVVTIHRFFAGSLAEVYRNGLGVVIFAARALVPASERKTQSDDREGHEARAHQETGP
jgi:hypothetical protein